MKVSGIFTIRSTNIETGEVKEVSSGNIITNNFYRDILNDGSNRSIGFYLWTTPHEMTKSRRRQNIEASAMFLNDAYGYMPPLDWFARYVEAESNMPGYFETRNRIDPPDTGIRVIRSIIMTDRQPRTDNVTGLLPDHPVSTVIDTRTITPSSVGYHKANIFAYAVLEDDCIQTEVEVFDIYYRLVFDNNYGNVNLSKTAIELVGKQSTAKRPNINNAGSIMVSTPVNPPQLSAAGPVNFILPTITSSGINPQNGDVWHDYGNTLPTTKISNNYVTTYSVNLEKDAHVGKIFNTLYCTGYNQGNYLSGFKTLYRAGDSTIGNTHSHSNQGQYPFFDAGRLSRGTGYCDMTSIVDPIFPERIEVKIIDGGSVDNASYKISTYPFTGFYKNNKETLITDIPHISQMVINNGSWRGGKYYQGTDNMYGFLTGKSGTHPSGSGMVYDTASNSVVNLGRVGISGYSGFRELSEKELIGYDKDGISILSLGGSVRSINSSSYSQFTPSNIIQVEADDSTGFIYAACKETGLYKINNSLSSSGKIIPFGVTSTERCYGYDMYQDKGIAFFDTAIFYTTNGGATWTEYPHPDYFSNGLDKTKIIGVRADLSSITPNVLILFSNVDGLYTTSKTSVTLAWWSPSVFTPVNVSPSMWAFGTSPSFNGIDYIKVVSGKFYFTFNLVNSGGGYRSGIYSMLFNTSSLASVFIWVNSSTDGIPLYFKKGGKDYVVTVGGSTIFIYNITDNIQEASVAGYGSYSSFITSLNMPGSPYYYTPMSNGLIIYRMNEVMSRNINNSSVNPNIRNNLAEESANTLVTKIVNPFYNKTSESLFRKDYGWDGNQFSRNSTSAKVISSGPNTFDGVTITFTGINDPLDFVAEDSFSTTRTRGFVKDNASLAKVFFSNSNFLKTNRLNQSGLIAPVPTFYRMGQFEFEECDTTYTSTHIGIKSRSTPYDFLYTRKIPQEAGTMKITIDSSINCGYGIVFDTSFPNSNNSNNFGIIIYKSSSTNYKLRITSSRPSYRKDRMVTINTSYSENNLVAGDIVEVSYYPGSTRRVFVLKINGSVIINGANFNGESSNTNSSQLVMYHVPLTIAYPCSDDRLIIPKPEFRYDSFGNIISIPLSDFINDNDGLTINGNNYGKYGDTVVRVNGALSENAGIINGVREIPTGHCAIDNLSGTVYLSVNDETKDYSVEYVYYKDSE